MAKLGDFFPSPFLKSADIDEPMVVTIQGVHEAVFPGKNGKPDESRPVATFAEFEQGLILNRTNFGRIAKLTGKPDTDDWTGARVLLRVEAVEAFGETVDAIRVHPAPTQARFSGKEDLPSWVTDPA